MKFRWDDFALDTEAYRLERAGEPVALEPKAFDVLVLLLQRAGKLVTKQEILDAVWPQTAVTEYALTRVIAQLRKTLGDAAHEARFIETVPTRGYRWIRPLAADLGGRATHASPVPVASPLPVASPSRWAMRFRRIEAVAAGAILAMVATGFLVNAWRDRQRQQPGGPDWQPPNVAIAFPQQLTTGAGLDLQPALSPQGDAVAFSSDRGGTLEIYVRALGGNPSDTPVTRDGGQNAQPAWSPDGRFIAYHSYAKGGVWLVPARGGVPRQVTPVGSHPAWSPDGSQLAFQTDEFADVTPRAWPAQTGSVIGVVHADGSGRREVTATGKPGGGHGAPVWNPNGRQIAFATFEGGLHDGPWTVDLANGAVDQLLVLGGVFELAYAPDGSAIYAASGQGLIIKLPIDPTTGDVAGPREVIPIPGVDSVRGMSISADGTRLVFASLSLNSQIWAQPVRPDGAAAGEPRALTNDRNSRNSVPVVSPDGTRIAYNATRAGQPPNIWIMDVDGRNPLQITSDETSDAHANWFPDARRIAYTSNRNARAGLWSVDIQTRREELLMEIGDLRGSGGAARMKGRLAEFRLSRSMKQAVFSLQVPPYEHRVIYVTPIGTLTPRKLTDASLSVGYPSWSPDERLIAVEIKEGSSTHAAVIDVATGALRKLTNDRGHAWVRGWSPDSRKIALASFQGGQWSLRWLDAATGEQGTLVPPAPVHVYVRYPEWSSQGNVVVYERGEVTGNLWSIRLRNETHSSTR